MDQSPVGWTLFELAEIVGGVLHGPSDLRIARPVPAGDHDPEGITFAESAKYLTAVEASGVGAVFVHLEEEGCKKPHIRCRSPREAFGRILAMAWREVPLCEGVHPSAIVSPNAEIDGDASIGPFSVVEGGTKVGYAARVYPFCYVGEDCRLGAGAKLYPNVTLYRDVWLGERTVVHSGAVLGADGFGYFWDGTRHRKVPQAGGVRIGDDCEIGALTAVDRATAGETRLHKGVKLDNLVQVAHNVEIGCDTVIASMTGVAGSSRVGERNIFAGQVGLADHVSTANDVHLGARAVVSSAITEPGQYLGDPARPALQEQRSRVGAAKLPELLRRVRQLEKELEALRAKL